MHTLELLDYMIDLARRLSYDVREEWLDGKFGGSCEIKGRSVLFVDLSLPPSERLEQVAAPLRECKELAQVYILPEAQAVLDRAA